MLNYSLNSILEIIPPKEIVGLTNVEFNNASSIFEGNEKSISWIKSSLKDYEEFLKKSKACVILCDSKTNIPDNLKSEKCFLIYDDPKYSFLEILENLFAPGILAPGIHSTAIIDKSAVISKTARIEAYCVIGKAIIGENSIVHSHSTIKDNVEIGNNVIIHSNVLIGSQGFGFLRRKDGSLKKFPHIGKAVIEDDVEIFPFSNVDIGALGETRVKRGTKIDHYCHIGHNCLVGENTIITAGTVLCGGSKIGNNVWIGVNSVIKEKVSVSDNVFIGLNSLITKDVPVGESWLGSPAQCLDDFKKEREIIKKLKQ